MSIKNNSTSNFAIITTDEINNLTTELYEAMMDHECEEVQAITEQLTDKIKDIKLAFEV